MLELLILLNGIAFTTVGATGYAIFGPLTCRHLLDRGRGDEMDGSSLSPSGLRWILSGGWRRHRDDIGLRPLALPAQIMLWLVLVGATLLLLRWLMAQI